MLKHRVKTFFKRGKLFNIITSSKKKLFITSLILFVISISIFMPKGILKKSYKKILALAGVYTEEVKTLVSLGATKVVINSMTNLSEENKTNKVTYETIMNDLIENVRTEVNN